MEKIEIEYPIRSSTSILFDMISTPSGLSEWFADDVNIKDDVWTFLWDGSEEEAKLLTSKKDEFVKFHWVEHDEEKTYFEIRIKADQLTNDIALVVTDFCDEEDEEDTRELWESQLDSLAKRIGG